MELSIEDQVIAAMETGNTARARTMFAEYADADPQAAAVLGLHIMQEYGVFL